MHHIPAIVMTKKLHLYVLSISEDLILVQSDYWEYFYCPFKAIFSKTERGSDATESPILYSLLSQSVLQSASVSESDSAADSLEN